MRVDQSRQLHRDGFASARWSLNLRRLGDVGGHCERDATKQLNSFSDQINQLKLCLVTEAENF
jgi:hypothetical protein